LIAPDPQENPMPTPVADLAPQITDLLDGDWVITPQDSFRDATAILARAEDNVTLLLTLVKANPDRVQVVGIYPDGYDWGDLYRMTASLTPDMSTFARDVNRAINAARAALITKHAVEAAAAQLRTDVAAVLGRTDGYPSYMGVSGDGRYDQARASFTIQDDNRSNVQINGMNAEQTLALAHWLTINVPVSVTA
jgi:hypothetical protein